MRLWQPARNFKHHWKFTPHAHNSRHVAMPTDRLWKRFIIPQQVSWIHKLSSSFIVNLIIVPEFCMDLIFTHHALAYGSSRWNIRPCWPVRSTCTRACLQILSPSLYTCLLEDIFPRWTECVTLQVQNGRPAQTCQAFERGWTSKKSLVYLRRLFAISTDEEELLEEKTSDWIGYVGWLGERVEWWLFASVSRVSVWWGNALDQVYGRDGWQIEVIDTRFGVQSTGIMR